MVAIATEGSSDTYQQFVDDHGLGSFTLISDDGNTARVADLLAEFDVASTPTFVMIRGSGEYRTEIGFNKFLLTSDFHWLSG